MKKIFNCLLIGVVAMLAAGCSNSREAENVAQKVQSGESLNKGDYTCLIEYLGEYAETAQGYQDVIDNSEPGSAEAAKAQKELSELTSSHKYLVLFNKVLKQTTAAEVGEGNVALVNRYAPLIWFDAPDWATIQGGPASVAGDVVEMQDDTAGVIATDVPEEKIERR